MRRTATLVLGAAAAIVGAPRAPDAVGGESSAGTRINGRDVDPAGPLTLQAGDRVESGTSAPRVRAATGAAIDVFPESSLSHMGTERGVESFFVLAGTAEADVGAATILGAAAGWATAAGDEAARVRITVAPSGSRGTAGGSAKDAATVRAVAGNVWVRFHAVATWLPADCEARLVPSADGPGSLACSAASSNPQPIDLTRATGGLTHAATLPAGSAVTLADRAGGTWYECRAAEPGHPVRIEVRRGADVIQSATIGRGAATRVSGAEIVVEIPGLAIGLLPSLTRLDREFATLGGE